MRKIIYTRPGGELSVVHPVRNTLGEQLIPSSSILDANGEPVTPLRPLTDEEIEQRAWDALPKDAINPQFVDESEIPPDRTFRDAWTHGGNTVNIDMDKAKAIHVQRLADAALQAQAAQQKQAAAAAIDMTAINAAATIDQLVALDQARLDQG